MSSQSFNPALPIVDLSPVAWVRPITCGGGGDSGPPDYDVEFADGSEQPKHGTCWIPLFTRPQSTLSLASCKVLRCQMLLTLTQFRNCQQLSRNYGTAHLGNHYQKINADKLSCFLNDLGGMAGAW